MSSGDALLIFIDSLHRFDGWLLLSQGAVAARGAVLEELPDLVDPETRDPLTIVAVVPGDTVALHWLEVPGGLAPAQAVAAARLIAAEVSAQPLADLHVAVGPEFAGSEVRTVALTPALTMLDWLGRLQAEGLDPDIVVPEMLLLPAPEEGFVRHDSGPVPLFRGPSDAFSIELELAEAVLGDAPVTLLDRDGFEAGLAAALASLPVNLRQGAFAKRRRWKIEWATVRRMVLLGLGLLLLTLAIQIASIMRYTSAADAVAAEADAIGGEALARRLEALGGAGVGYSALAAALFGAVQATAGTDVGAINFDRGALRATVSADSAPLLTELSGRIEAAGFVVEAGEIQSGGRPSVEMKVRAR